MKVAWKLYVGNLFFVFSDCDVDVLINFAIIFWSKLFISLLWKSHQFMIVTLVQLFSIQLRIFIGIGLIGIMEFV